MTNAIDANLWKTSIDFQGWLPSSKFTLALPDGFWKISFHYKKAMFSSMPFLPPLNHHQPSPIINHYQPSTILNHPEPWSSNVQQPTCASSTPCFRWPITGRCREGAGFVAQLRTPRDPSGFWPFFLGVVLGELGDVIFLMWGKT